MKVRNLLFLFSPLIILSYITVALDSDWWINSGKLFFNALINADLKGTYLDFEVQNHPGLSFQWISALIQFLLPTNLQNFLVPLHSLHNLIFATFMVVCLGLGFSILSKTFSKEAVIASALYIILLPNLMFPNGSTYLDWILSGTLFLSTALWLEYLNNKRFSLIFWVGILIGISFLTKYVSVLILPAFFVLALLKRYPIKKLIKSLTPILLIAFIVFIIFYPALWVDPTHVLSDLFGKKESIYNFTVSASNIKEIWVEILKLGPKLNPMLFLGSALTLICLFTKTVKKETLLPGIAGFIYLIGLIAAIHVIFYSRTTLLTSIYQLDRYTLPATVLFTVTFFGVMFEDQKLKESYLLRNTLIVLLFLHEITKIAIYIIFTYITYIGPYS